MVWEHVEFETPEGTFSGEFTDLRVPEKDVPKGKHVYECRHGDEDWATPVSIEKFVVVTHAGTLMTDQPLPLKDGRLSVKEWWYTDGDR